MLAKFYEWNIKNIFWDVDGVLANLNHACYSFIKNHPQFKDHFKQYLYKDLDKALPVDEENYGSIELKTHPTLGDELDRVFCESDDYYFDRPLYYGTKQVLRVLNEKGYNQFILSAGFNLKKKKRLLEMLFSDLDFLKIDIVLHDKDGMHAGSTKGDKIVDILNKNSLKKSETTIIDDRIYNIRTALQVGIHAVRFRSEFTTQTPDDLKDVPEVKSIWEFLR